MYKVKHDDGGQNQIARGLNLARYVNKLPYTTPNRDLERTIQYSANSIRSMIGVDRRIMNLNAELTAEKLLNVNLRTGMESQFNNTLKTVNLTDFVKAARIFVLNQYEESGKFFRRVKVSKIREKNRVNKEKVYEVIWRQITDTNSLYKRDISYNPNARNAYIIFCGKSDFANLSFKKCHGRKLLLFLPTFKFFLLTQITMHFHM